MKNSLSCKICDTLIITTLVLVLGIIDYLKGYEMSFFVFYFIPIAIMTSNYGAKAGYVVCLVCTGTWFAADWFGGYLYPSKWMAYWNAGIRFAAFATVAYYIARTRTLLSFAKNEVKTLRGFLPICAKCKKIRDDKGYWEQIESYISDHADVKFSHGYCDQCAAELSLEIEEYKRRIQRDPTTVSAKLVPLITHSRN